MPESPYIDAYIDGTGPHPAVLHIEQEVNVVTGALPRPDPAWTFTDPAGHWHAYDDDQELPTLNEVRTYLGCDGSCGDDDCHGSPTIRYECRICRAPVEPGALTGPYTIEMPGLYDWRADVTGWMPQSLHGDMVSVRFDTPHGRWFGVALPADLYAESNEPVKVTLAGNGPLGHRKAEATGRGCTCDLIDVSGPDGPAFVRGKSNGCKVHPPTDADRQRQEAIDAAKREARAR